MTVALHCSCILFINGHSTQRIEYISFIFQNVPEERPRQKNVQQDVNKSTDSVNLGDVSSTSIEASIEVGEDCVIGTTVIERNTSVAESTVSCDFFSFLFSIFVLPKDQKIVNCPVIYTTGFCVFCIPVKGQNIILCYEKYSLCRHFCVKTHSSLDKSSGCRLKHTYITDFNSLYLICIILGTSDFIICRLGPPSAAALAKVRIVDVSPCSFQDCVVLGHSSHSYNFILLRDILASTLIAVPNLVGVNNVQIRQYLFQLIEKYFHWIEDSLNFFRMKNYSGKLKTRAGQCLLEKNISRGNLFANMMENCAAMEYCAKTKRNMKN